MSTTTQAIVIGSGPGGYVCAIRLAQLGVKTVVVELGELGGVCLNVGCIPSKALITASKHYQATGKKLAEMGILVDGARVEMGTMQAWKAGVVKKLTSGVGTLLKGNGVTVVRGKARFVAADTLEVTDPSGATQRLQAPAIVVATGSRPTPIPAFPVDQEHVLDSTGALALSEVPKRLVVIGGGYIGLELGGVFARLGAQVTVLELMPQLLPGFDLDLVRPVEKGLKKAGAEVLTETRAVSWRKADDGNGLSVTVQVKDVTRELRCDKILVTVGRRPNSDGLGLESLGVDIDRGGFIKVDSRLETSVPGVYAIGDVAGNPMLAHKASKEGEVVAEVIAGKPSVWDVRGIPAVVFTDPEIATVGLTEAEAKAKGHTVRVGKVPFAGLGRAMTTGETEGFARVVADAKTHALLGVQIVGPEASDLIAEAGLALEMGAYADDVGLTIHAHPTLAEAVMEAAKAATGEAIHLMNR